MIRYFGRDTRDLVGRYQISCIKKSFKKIEKSIVRSFSAAGIPLPLLLGNEFPEEPCLLPIQRDMTGQLVGNHGFGLLDSGSQYSRASLSKKKGYIHGNYTPYITDRMLNVDPIIL